MKTLKNILFCVFILITYANLGAKTSVKEAIVKIYTVYNEPSYYEPWQMIGQERRTGSGSIISGNRILTNAHVVGDHTFIQVRRTGMAKRYQARVESVAHECDLAIIKIMDESFFSGIKPLDFGELPEVRDKVVVYGFPIGGDELSITEGIVSRVEHQKYVHSKAYLLTCQIDAAINPGNSGGPVIKDDKIVGVASQVGRGENIGYMVPVPVIQHFLKDIEDGKYDGIPGLGISWQKMESPDLRKKYNLSEDQTGILVIKIYPGSPAKEKLKNDDIILAIDGVSIENNGTVEFRKNERTQFAYLIQKKYIGDSLSFKILRNGGFKDIEIILTKSTNFWRLVPHDLYDSPPVYYILGGLVFEPLTVNFLKEWGGSWWNRAPKNLVNYYYYGEPLEDRRQVIVLTKVLAHELNAGYHDLMYNVITEVNGMKISTIRDLVQAFENHTGKYHTIIDENGYRLVLDKEKVDAGSEEILKTYKIDSAQSK